MEIRAGFCHVDQFSSCFLPSFVFGNAASGPSSFCSFSSSKAPGRDSQSSHRLAMMCQCCETEFLVLCTWCTELVQEVPQPSQAALLTALDNIPDFRCHSPMRFWTSWKISKYSARAVQSEDAMTNMSWGVKLLLPYCNGIAESNTLSCWIWWVVPIGVIYNCGKHPTNFAPTSSWKKRITCVSNLAQPKMLSNEWMHWGENAKWGKNKGVSTTKLAWAHWTHWHWLSHAGSCSPSRDIRLTCSSKPSTACPPLPSSSCFKASTLSYTMLHSYRLLLYVQAYCIPGWIQSNPKWKQQKTWNLYRRLFQSMDVQHRLPSHIRRATPWHLQRCLKKWYCCSERRPAESEQLRCCANGTPWFSERLTNLHFFLHLFQ